MLITTILNVFCNNCRYELSDSGVSLCPHPPCFLHQWIIFLPFSWSAWGHNKTWTVDFGLDHGLGFFFSVWLFAFGDLIQREEESLELVAD